ncbi:tryptophanyl-tRNA synthetase [Platysternon megacephalum]|uniref:Tryptophanyl-tRNA synthetase n=1 Tax=Platysternon megacephalum TaxID=55544 RepID=A0A4D9DK85_9SAUR|nr:tryptophanyl-tRNA synthetase [Platysternon megacephalum]
MLKMYRNLLFIWHDANPGSRNSTEAVFAVDLLENRDSMSGQETPESPDEEKKNTGCFSAWNRPKAKKTLEPTDREKCKRKKKRCWPCALFSGTSKGSAGGLNQGEETPESPQDLVARKKGGLNQELESETHQTPVSKIGLNEGHVSESPQALEAREKGGLNQGLESEPHQAPQLGKKYGLNQAQASGTCQTSEMKVKESLNHGQGSQTPRAPELGWKDHIKQGHESQILRAPELGLKNSLNQGQGSQTPRALDVGFQYGFNQEQQPQTVQRPAPREKNSLNRGLEPEAQRDPGTKDTDAHKGGSNQGEGPSESPQVLEARRKGGLNQGLESELHQAPELGGKYGLNQAQASGCCQRPEIKVKESLNHEQRSQTPRALDVGFKYGFNQEQQPQTLQGPAPREKNSLNQGLEPEAQRDPRAKDTDAHKGGLNQGEETPESPQDLVARKKGGLNQELESETHQTQVPKGGLNEGQESESPQALEAREKGGLSQGLESEPHQAPQLGKKYGLNQAQASGTCQTSEMKVKESLNHGQGSQTPRAPELGWKDHIKQEHESQILRAPELGLKNSLNEGQGSQTPRALDVGFQYGFNQEQQPQTLQGPAPREKNSLNRGLEPEAQRDAGTKDTDAHKGRRAFHDLFCKLEMEQHQNKKFRLSNVLEVCPENTKDWTAQTVGDLPWHFLRKVMSLNVMARNTSLMNRATDDSEDWVDDEGQGSINFPYCSDIDTGASVNPLDILCAVLLCSDSFLQQEILSKMSMCQFALPLLLPALDTPKCTLLLWAMRDIVRKWRPHSLAESRGFREESLVLTKMPTISFVRLGSCSFSKSRLLNEVLSPSQQHHDFFIHRDMESGNVPREIADGLVEISWYFPSGLVNSDLFPEPVAVTNLRGDIESHWLQFSFLTQVSSAVFIITESIDEREYALLSSLQGSATKYYFILSGQSGNFYETQTFLKKLTPILKLKKSQLLMKDNIPSMAKFVKKLQSTIGHIMNSSQKKMGIENMVITAHELGIQVDEDCEKCQSARRYSEEIAAEIKDVAKYKKERLRLQGELWKNLAEVEKELCQMKKQKDTHPEVYKSQLRMKLLELRTEQNLCGEGSGFKHFINRLRQLHPVEKHYFLKWMKFNLDHIARGNLSRLREEYKQKCETLGDDPQQLAQLDKLISASSLGTEHFMRELGQFYEAECSMVKEGKILKSGRQFTHLPGIAADLMLEGFPMELIDGDITWSSLLHCAEGTKKGYKRPKGLVCTSPGGSQ